MKGGLRVVEPKLSGQNSPGDRVAFVPGRRSFLPFPDQLLRSHLRFGQRHQFGINTTQYRRVWLIFRSAHDRVVLNNFN